jgi:hypothetical protein
VAKLGGYLFTAKKFVAIIYEKGIDNFKILSHYEN